MSSHSELEDSFDSRPLSQHILSWSQRRLLTPSERLVAPVPSISCTSAPCVSSAPVSSTSTALAPSIPVVVAPERSQNLSQANPNSLEHPYTSYEQSLAGGRLGNTFEYIRDGEHSASSSRGPLASSNSLRSQRAGISHQNR